MGLMIALGEGKMALHIVIVVTPVYGVTVIRGSEWNRSSIVTKYPSFRLFVPKYSTLRSFAPTIVQIRVGSLFLFAHGLLVEFYFLL